MPRAKKEIKEVEVVYITAEPKEKTNGLAVASFVLSLCGIFTFGFTTLLGFVLGVVSIYQIKRSGERGEGLAVTAIVLGCMLISVFIIGVIVS